MKGLDRLTIVRLAEVLSQNGSVATEHITDALYQQDKTGIPFVDLLIESGEISEWDIAKCVVQHFQLPFLMTSNLDIDRKAVDLLPEDFVFQHRLVPFNRCGDVLSISMPILTPFKVLTKAQSLCSHEIFPFVGLTSENRKILSELFPDHKELDPIERMVAAENCLDSDSSWQNIFDIGDEQVLKDLDR